ncbi:hypothetical protein F383_23378 [Gossypium arboreum]|uniref:Uncharacterized protein n=1 Tax=Gossypium arboreum TaxID=29729 RepID=A0A0B0NZ91_GOSAR|nr:hypothetical protein F383_23378 [Gossypium arboreum]
MYVVLIWAYGPYRL